MSDTNTNTQQQITLTPEAEGGEKLFSQAQVNAIVQERLAREREKLADGSEYKAKYEAAQKELEGIKAEQARAAKEAAVRAYYQQKGVTGKALEIAMKGSRAEIDALELADGQVKDYGPIDGLIGGVFAGLVSTTVVKGADVAHPPMYGHTPTDDQLIAGAFKPKI